MQNFYNEIRHLFTSNNKCMKLTSNQRKFKFKNGLLWRVFPSCLYHNHQNMQKACCEKPRQITTINAISSTKNCHCHHQNHCYTPPVNHYDQSIENFSQVLENPNWEWEWKKRKLFPTKHCLVSN